MEKSVSASDIVCNLEVSEPEKVTCPNLIHDICIGTVVCHSLVMPHISESG